MKRFVAWARVSSREQQQEGFSLAVQEDALSRYAEREGGEVVKMFVVAETASRTGERTKFREMLAFVRAEAKRKKGGGLAGMLFYKLDRATRNMYDFVDLERVEDECGVPIVCVTQPMQNNPSGRMHRVMLAGMARHYSEQLGLDTQSGHARRVQEGWFPAWTPYGYTTQRIEKRSTVITSPNEAANVRRIFELYSSGHVTLDQVCVKLLEEGRVYQPAQPRFPRSTVHKLLRDRSYIGEIFYQGTWHQGRHEPLVAMATWQRVQDLINARGGRVRHSHELPYAGGRVMCGVPGCGRMITGERKTKKGVDYTYYRCAAYTAPGHPRERVPEAELDRQTVEMLGGLMQEPDVAEWFRAALLAAAKEGQAAAAARRAELQRDARTIADQQDRLLNLHLAGAIDVPMFTAKNDLLRDRAKVVATQIEGLDLGRAEEAELAVRVFELSQSLKTKWFSADYAEKGEILDFVSLNRSLNGKTLRFTLRSPFDLLSDRLGVQSNSGDWI